MLKANWSVPDSGVGCVCVCVCVCVRYSISFHRIKKKLKVERGKEFYEHRYLFLFIFEYLLLSTILKYNDSKKVLFELSQINMQTNKDMVLSWEAFIEYTSNNVVINNTSQD